MKTDRFLTASNEHRLRSGLTGMGTQLAAVLLAVLVTPSTLPTRDAHAHAHAAPVLDRGAALRTPGWR